MTPGQRNNVYVFPGVGLGVIACNASRVTEEMFLDAAHTLADCVTEEDLKSGAFYPPLSQIRAISLAIATVVAKRAYAQGLAVEPEPVDIEGFIKEKMYDPSY